MLRCRTHHNEETDALRACAAATEEADDGNGAADPNEDIGHLVHEVRVFRPSHDVQVHERGSVKVHPDSDTQHA